MALNMASVGFNPASLDPTPPLNRGHSFRGQQAESSKDQTLLRGLSVGLLARIGYVKKIYPIFCKGKSLNICIKRLEKYVSPWENDL